MDVNIGYLPQDVELLAGTVAQNIGRFDLEADPKAILAAAKATGVHELVVELSEGYKTQAGERGEVYRPDRRNGSHLPFDIIFAEPDRMSPAIAATSFRDLRRDTS